MKKIKIVSIALILGIVMVFGVAGCNTGAQNELQSKIDDLQNQIAQMEDRLAEMEDQIRERDATIEGLNEQIKKQDEKIEQLEELVGSFYSVVYDGVSYNWSKDLKNFVGICSSYNDLIELCTKNNCGFYDEENQDYESDFGKKVREFTEEYFKSKSLVVCAFTESSYSGALKVLSLEIVDSTLTVKINRPFNGTAQDVAVCWGFIIEVDKSIVSGVKISEYLVVSI